MNAKRNLNGTTYRARVYGRTTVPRTPGLPYIVLLTLLLLSACGGGDEHADHGDMTYTCPMHPEIVRDEPGQCPICGMDLVPVQPATTVDLSDQDLDAVLLPPNQAVLARVELVTPLRDARPATLEATGEITYDPRRTYALAARVSGRIERLRVRYNGQPIRKGQLVLEVYSPELVTAQRELLLLARDSATAPLLEATRRRLLLLGMTPAQLQRVLRTGQPLLTVGMYSPHSGYVVELSSPTEAPVTPGTAGASGGMSGGGMGGGTAAPATAGPPIGTELQLREGAYVTAGQTLLRIVDPSRVWAEFDLPAAAPVGVGSSVQVTPDGRPELELNASITSIQPVLEPGAAFKRVRATLPNPKETLQIGQLVVGQFESPTDTALWVPATAVVDLGRRQVVFVHGDEGFRPRAVQTGRHAGELIEVREGVTVTDSLARNGQFLVDSEGFIRLENMD